MKKTFALILSIVLLAAIESSSNSCSPSESPNETPDVDTTRLYVIPSILNLTRADSSEASEVTISCTCKFAPLIVTGYGWDTNVIHFSFMEALTDTISPHTLYAAISPSFLKSSGADSAWIGLYYMDASGTGSYDTIRAYASYY